MVTLVFPWMSGSARFRRRGWPVRLAALAGVLALLLQGALPIALAVPTAVGDRFDASYVGVFGDATSVALCGAERAVSNDDRPAKPDSSHRCAPCPLCLATQHAASLLPPAAVATPQPAPAVVRITGRVVTKPRPLRATADAQARAPPQDG